MATSSQPAGPSDEGPPYRSFNELQYNPTVGVYFSPAAKRLFWPLDGVFPTALSVMKTPRSADDLEPYFQQTPGGGICHEIAQLPMTKPKVLSIEVSIYDLEQWEWNWVNDEDRPYAAEAKEDGSWEDSSDTEFLIRCCGEDRPLRKRGQKLVVTPAASGYFVTVHDYVSAVHPWLMGLRSEILLAKAELKGTAHRVLPLPRQPRFSQDYVLIETGDFHIKVLSTLRGVLRNMALTSAFNIAEREAAQKCRTVTVPSTPATQQGGNTPPLPVLEKQKMAWIPNYSFA
ncbi:LysM domain-containing protein [Diaporthe eres]|nr:LysM domain-containing protein [Diaporthe eres]